MTTITPELLAEPAALPPAAPAPTWELVAQLGGTLKAWQEAMGRHGNWDDGCFYYSGKSASELQSTIEATDEALAAIARAMKGRR